MELIDKTAPATASPFGALFGLLYEPSATFASLAQRRATWIPVVTVSIATAVLMLWYFLHFVDYAWLQDHMLAAITDPAEREQANSMGMAQQTMGIMTAVGGAIALVASFALSGIYFMVVGKVKNREFGFRKGFSLSAWASVPTLLLLPLGILQMVLAPHPQMSLEALNPTTLNQLVFHFEATHPLAGLLETISIPFAWSLVLLVIGYQAWAGVTRASAARIVLLPYAVIYGIWLAYALSNV